MASENTTNYLDFSVTAQDGSTVPLSTYAGKVLLVVNTATGCGFTPQYEDLERIYAAHKDQGLEILDFPCNQFAGQAPESDDQINQFCSLKFNTEFPRFKKLDVNGDTADPLFAALATERPFQGFGDGLKAAALDKFAKANNKKFGEKAYISCGTSPSSSSTVTATSWPASSPPPAWTRSSAQSRRSSSGRHPTANHGSAGITTGGPLRNEGPPKAPAPDNQLCFPLYACSKEVVRSYQPLLGPLGLTYTQYLCMMVLWEEGAATVSHLGERLYLDSGTLTPVLKKLEKSGYITRERSVADARVLEVRLTPKGLDLRDRAASVPAAMACHVHLSADEAAELKRLLAKVLASVRDGEPTCSNACTQTEGSENQ